MDLLDLPVQRPVSRWWYPDLWDPVKSFFQKESSGSFGVVSFDAVPYHSVLLLWLPLIEQRRPTLLFFKTL